jgi:hypothetical protein
MPVGHHTLFDMQYVGGGGGSSMDASKVVHCSDHDTKYMHFKFVTN